MYTSHVYKQCTAWKVPRWLNMGKKCDGGFLSTLLNKVLNATQSHWVIQFYIVLFWHTLDQCINGHLKKKKNKLSGSLKKDFRPKINILKENHCTLKIYPQRNHQKRSKIWLSEWILYFKNYLNLSDFFQLGLCNSSVAHFLTTSIFEPL